MYLGRVTDASFPFELLSFFLVGALALAVARCLTLGVVTQANAALDATPLTEPRANSDTVTDVGADGDADSETPVEPFVGGTPKANSRTTNFNVASRASSRASATASRVRLRRNAVPMYWRDRRSRGRAGTDGQQTV
ncbi:hypothetical protein [Natronobacterium gregoryi]|nr:hypothetical protein Natgr_1766 [Natronobacterium gregoryi SP2]SFI68557.1 hypothetical protein SAMN05443661_103132 [Natronobacterium gregoryi]